ncbi:MAG: hypothetical protein K8I60_20935, partial [Anaerolineae bacterium]|nr:hypothetical protein [Anaerolineae bacterium]
MIELLSSYSGIPVDELEYFLSFSPAEIYHNERYKALVSQINGLKLENSLSAIRAAYDEHLPAIKDKYHLRYTLMSGYTLSSWILGYISFPDTMPDLLDRHKKVPSHVVKAVLPELLELLGTVPEGAAEWQRA